MTGTAEDTQVQREAAFWVSVIELDEPSAVDTARFERWLEEDLANAQAYEQVVQLWRDSAELTHLGEIEQPRPFEARRERGSLSGWGARITAPAGAIAGLALVALVAVVLLGWPFGDSAENMHATDIGEIREIVLADGSEITLGPKSRLEVSFEAKERRVILGEGEAFFEVASQSDRPFRVTADGAAVRVLGTRFNVHEGPRGITVAVAEGRVEVETGAGSEKSSGGSPPVEQRRHLRPGEKAVASAMRGLISIERVSPDLPGAWRQGRLVYQDATLAEVVADANRYSRTPIEIGSAELEELRVFATFRTAEIDRLIAELEGSLPVVAERNRDGRIVLRSAESSTG